MQVGSVGGAAVRRQQSERRGNYCIGIQFQGAGRVGSVAVAAPTHEGVRGVVPTRGDDDRDALRVGRGACRVDGAALTGGGSQGVGGQRGLGRLRGVRGAVGQVERGDVVEADLAQAGRNAAAEAGIAREVDLAQVGQPTQLAGDRSAQLVVIEAQIGQVGERTQLSRDRPGELVARQVQPAQLEQPAESRRDRPGQTIAVEVEGCQTGEVAELRRDRTGQADPVRQGLRCAEDQVGELRADRTQLGRDRAGQMVGGQVEKGEAGEASQFRWDRPSQLIAPGQAQLAQCGQLAQLGGNRTVQSLAIHVQFGHPLDAVQRPDGDPVPGAERRVGAPVERRRAGQGRLQIEQDGDSRRPVGDGRRGWG